MFFNVWCFDFVEKNSMLITLVNYCFFHSSFFNVFVHSCPIFPATCLSFLGNGDSHYKSHALRCVTSRSTDKFVVRWFAAIVAESVHYVTHVPVAWRERYCFCTVKIAEKVIPYAWENAIFITERCTRNKRCFTSLRLEHIKQKGIFTATTVAK